MDDVVVPAAGTPPGSPRVPCVLTVGDGDLSFSLGLARCYGAGLRLVATTLATEPELLATYARAGAILSELRARRVEVRHGVDAALLGQHSARAATSGPRNRWRRCQICWHPALPPRSHWHVTARATTKGMRWQGGARARTGRTPPDGHGGGADRDGWRAGNGRTRRLEGGVGAT